MRDEVKKESKLTPTQRDIQRAIKKESNSRDYQRRKAARTSFNYFFPSNTCKINGKTLS
jgi:hypothetical protein